MRPYVPARPHPVLVLLLALAALLVPAVPAYGAGRVPARPLAATGTGLLAGRQLDGVQAFLGVPYAAPPTGARRFRPPQPPARWDGVRQAAQQAPACLQFSPFGLSDPQNVSEDCLYLDVYRPADAAPGARLPVLFWIHGGAYSQGTGTQFGGATLARLTGTVVVSINYRLGQLGYLALPQFDQEGTPGSGTWGLQDQIAALSWTRRNAAAFGGDPANITIAGQSAGAGSVCALLTAPSTAGLFSHAILQSGPCTLLSAPDQQAAGADGQAYAEAAGCPPGPDTLTCLRAAPPAALLAAAANHPTPGPATGTPVLPRGPAEAIAAGAWHQVPILIGSNAAEARLLVALTQPRLTAEQYTAQVTVAYGADAPRVLAAYPLTAYGSPYLAYSALLTDATFACHTYWTAALLRTQVPTYVYEFDDPNSPTLAGAQVPGLDESNAHSAELAYLFDFTMGDRPLTSAQLELADRMKRSWAAFARTGNPNTPGPPVWPTAGGGDSYRARSLRPDGATRTITTFADDHRCALWASVPGAAGGRPAAAGGR
ncbi:carboxylesterase family protein [Kitasatospora sp. NPDC049258]|uniref:carboxylesterase/lipase family protein n=1 Tax=Kitasatospora sp. NPDC049258 TaxID=3155394 RepID=UPI00341D6D43